MKSVTFDLPASPLCVQQGRKVILEIDEAKKLANALCDQIGWYTLEGGELLTTDLLDRDDY